MKKFIDIDEVDEWFAEMDYEQFWEEAALFSLTLPAKDECDRQILEGQESVKTVLGGLKYLARHEIADRQQLRRRLPNVS